MGAKKQNAEERFWSKVRKDESGCWIWTAAKFKDGYGLFKLDYKSGKHFVVRAHRHSFAMHHGRQPPSGVFICHTCDVRACVNPEHLFEGTPQENVHDAMKKGRWTHSAANLPHPSGEKHWNSILKDEDIPLVRAAVASGMNQRAVAAKFGCSQQLVSRIIRGTHR